MQEGSEEGRGDHGMKGGSIQGEVRREEVPWRGYTRDEGVES